MEKTTGRVKGDTDREGENSVVRGTLRIWKRLVRVGKAFGVTDQEPQIGDCK